MHPLGEIQNKLKDLIHFSILPHLNKVLWRSLLNIGSYLLKGKSIPESAIGRFFRGILPSKRSACNGNCLSAKGASFAVAAERGGTGSKKDPERKGDDLPRLHIS